MLRSCAKFQRIFRKIKIFLKTQEKNRTRPPLIQTETGGRPRFRGMAIGSENMSYSQYRVLKPIEMRVGPVSPVPEFGASGGATQYLPGKLFGS